MFSTISGFIVAIIVFCLMWSASRRFGETLRFRLFESGAFGVLAGLFTALSPKVPGWVAMVFLLTELLLMAYIVVWWKINGSTIPELINIALIDLLLMLVGKSSAARILAITENRYVVGTVRALPVIAFIISLGIFIVDMIIWSEKKESEGFEPDDYLIGDEKISDFKGSLIKRYFNKIRRWVSYEDEANIISFRSARNSSADC
ncbi:hypothetical protein IJI86_01340 [Candidatus Saccharibacteria bacterium]|nr:hypothetical protein [Candidatus Saccharibacteria bacterium]